MHIKKLTQGLVVAIALGLAAVASADEVPLTFTLGATQHLFDGARGVDDEILPMGAVEYRFDENWASEFTYSAGDADADSGGQEVDIDSWHLGGLYYTNPMGSVHPYLAIGGGELKRDFNAGSQSDTQGNLGAGFRYYIDDHWSWRADARWLHSFDENDNDVAISLGISYGFAAPPGRTAVRDSDRDGVPDAIDQCPNSPRGAQVNASGCADSDGDGVADNMDQCPNSPRGAQVDANGCEDSDGDGVANSIDQCPNSPPGAQVDSRGCVDSDRDGVPFKMDQCPDSARGSKVDARGCKIMEKRKASVELKVNFATDSNVVDQRYFSEIEGLADFLKRFPDLDVVIEGHTDSMGSDGYNQDLSQRRANAVRAVLITRYGIAANRVKAVGYGETRPLASNDSYAGRAENRRIIATMDVEYEQEVEIK